MDVNLRLAARTLRCGARHASFQTRTSPYCEKGIEPVVNIGPPRVCLTGEKPPLVLDDVLDTTTPAAARFAWHVNESTRSFAGAAGQTEAYELTCEEPGGAVLERHRLVIARGRDVTLNLGCGAGPTTLSNGTRLRSAPSGTPILGAAPSVDGVPAVFARARNLAKPPRVSTLRGRRMKSCTRRATRAAGGERRARAAQRACERRYGL